MATRRELERAHRWHCAAAGSHSTAPLKLLLFYAVECGLKAMLMKDRRVESSDELPTNYQVQHDIPLALTLLNAPPELQKIAKIGTTTVHKSPPQQQLRPSDLHQAFRYGVDVSGDDDVVTELKKILDWVKARI